MPKINLPKEMKTVTYEPGPKDTINLVPTYRGVMRLVAYVQERLIRSIQPVRPIS